MFNLFKKQSQAKVLVLSFRRFFNDYVSVLNDLRTLFEKKMSVSAFQILYANAENEDISNELSAFKRIWFEDVTLLKMSIAHAENISLTLEAGFVNYDDEVIFSCLLDETCDIGLKEIYQSIGVGNYLNYGYCYKIKVGNGLYDSYALDSTSAVQNVIDIEKPRLKENKMYCYREKKGLLLDGVMKDIFSSNLITGKHLTTIQNSSVLGFIRTHGLLEKLNDTVFYFQFFDKANLDDARKLAYKEKLVLCS